VHDYGTTWFIGCLKNSRSESPQKNPSFINEWAAKIYFNCEILLLLQEMIINLPSCQKTRKPLDWKDQESAIGTLPRYNPDGHSFSEVDLKGMWWLFWSLDLTSRTVTRKMASKKETKSALKQAENTLPIIKHTVRVFKSKRRTTKSAC
jgi:hypothetical protein